MHGRIMKWLQVALAGVVLALLTPAAWAGKLYWVQSFDDSIQRANLDGTGVEVLPTFIFDPIAVTVDPVGGRIYFIQSFDDKVRRADLNGANVATVLAPPQVVDPAAIAVDPAGGKIYCVQSVDDKIIRANFNGTGVETILAPPISLDPVAIAVDSAAGKVYWAENPGNRIRRANLNGTGAETVVDAIFVSGAVSIAVDGGNGKVYWAERAGNRIRRADTSGLDVNVTTFLDAVFVSDPVSIALDLVNARIYWAEGTSSRIRRADLSGANVLTILQPPLIFDPLSIAVDPTPEACCFPDGSCENLDEPVCVAGSGVSEGPGTTCTGLQACCQPDGVCDDLDPICCTVQGGFPQGPGTDCTTLTCPIPPLVILWNSDPLSPDRTTRSLRFTVQSTQTATPGQQAIKVMMVDLQHPNPRNLVQYPPPNFSTFDMATHGSCAGATTSPNFNGHHCAANAECLGPNTSITTDDGTCSLPGPACTGEGTATNANLNQGSCARWVGQPHTYYESQGPPLSGPYRAARLQCTPVYWDWITETATEPISVVGAEIVPSSQYSVQGFAETCKGTEAACGDVSVPVTMYTHRKGDLDAPYQSPSPAALTQADVLDISQAVAGVKHVLGAPLHHRVQMQPNLPELNADANVLDIVEVVDSVKRIPYAFSGPCVCPSTVTCGGSCTGCTGLCLKSCVGGDNDGETCVNNTHCPGVCSGGTNPGALCPSGVPGGANCVGTCVGGGNPGAACTNPGTQCTGGGTCSSSGCSGLCSAVGTCRDKCGRCNR